MLVGSDYSNICAPPVGQIWNRWWGIRIWVQKLHFVLSFKKPFKKGICICDDGYVEDANGQCVPTLVPCSPDGKCLPPPPLGKELIYITSTLFYKSWGRGNSLCSTAKVIDLYYLKRDQLKKEAL